MRTAGVFIIAALLLQVATGQEKSVVQGNPLETAFTTVSATVPQGYSLEFAVAYPPYSSRNYPAFGHISAGLSGVLQVSFGNDEVVSNMIGMIRPMNSWGLKLQVLSRREQLPSVALWVRSALGWQGDFLQSSDLWPKSPPPFEHLGGTQYEFTSTSAGVALEPGISEALDVNVSLGVRELESKNLWIFIEPTPMGDNGYHAASGDRTLLLDGSANVVLHALPHFAVIAEATTLPYFNVNVAALQLEVERAYAGAIGGRYTLPIPLSVDGYVRWQSTINGQSDTQFRLGLSGQFSFVP
jgi:hypothetical protein